MDNLFWIGFVGAIVAGLFAVMQAKKVMSTEQYLWDMQKEFMPEDTKVGMIQAWLDNCGEDYVCSLMIYREALSVSCWG